MIAAGMEIAIASSYAIFALLSTGAIFLFVAGKLERSVGGLD
jgi:hypothetical protein